MGESVGLEQSEVCAQVIKLDGFFWDTSSEVRTAVWAEGDVSILLKYESYPWILFAQVKSQ